MMVANHRNPWTPAQKARMAELRERKTPWEDVALEVGHSINSCTVTMSKMIHRGKPAVINEWTDAQIEKMVHLRAHGIAWDTIAREVGHSEGSCRAMTGKMRADARRAAAKVTRRMLRETADASMDRECIRPIPRVVARPAVDDYARSSITTAKLIVDAELRARIEVMGITGGLLGDPLPGRSALDKRRAACGGGSGASSGEGQR